IARLAREIVVTEKIDGTNGVVYVDEDGTVTAGSRSRWLTDDGPDNFGFRAWWGSGIQRGYGLTAGEKRFSLFNVKRWVLHGQEPRQIPQQNPTLPAKFQDVLPPCVGLVPVLYRGPFNTHAV